MAAGANLAGRTEFSRPSTHTIRFTGPASPNLISPIVHASTLSCYPNSAKGDVIGSEGLDRWKPIGICSEHQGTVLLPNLAGTVARNPEEVRSVNT